MCHMSVNIRTVLVFGKSPAAAAAAAARRRRSYCCCYCCCCCCYGCFVTTADATALLPLFLSPLRLCG